LRRDRRPDLRIQATALRDKEWQDDPDLLAAIHHAFLVLRRSVDLVEGRIGFHDDQLRYFLDLVADSMRSGTMTSAAGSELGDVTINLSVGPIELGGLERLWRGLTGQHEFALTVKSQPDTINSEASKLIYIVTRQGRVWFMESDNVTLLQRQTSIEDVTRKVAWVLSRQNAREAETLAQGTPPELNLLQGLQYLARYMDDLESIHPLQEAAKCFSELSKAGAQWAFQARLLEVVTLQLTQSRPELTAEQMLKLRDQYGNDRTRQAVITYNLGQIKFYQYSSKGYEEAIKEFEKIRRPFEWLWKLAPALWRGYLRLGSASWRYLPKYWRRIVFRSGRTAYQIYCLYCLAQCNIAITRAHMVNQNRRSVAENEKLAQQARGTAEKFKNELRETRPILGTAASEIEWRIYNTEVMLALNLVQNQTQGIEEAERALAIAPYALDVKANLGSLYLQVAAQKSGQPPHRTEEFMQARRIFEELAKVGWDPGFIKFRLGTIRRVEGLFQEAKSLLVEASDPQIRDVPQQYIDHQLGLTAKCDQRLTLGDI